MVLLSVAVGGGLKCTAPLCREEAYRRGAVAVASQDQPDRLSVLSSVALDLPEGR